MSTRIPVTLEGRITADPESGRSDKGTDWTRFDLAVNDRHLNEQTQKWEDGDAVYHSIAVFGDQAKHVAASLHKGDAVLVNGQLKFGNYTNPETGESRETRQIIADNVGASLKFASVEVTRAPKARGPEAYATGPVAATEVQSDAGATR